MLDGMALIVSPLIALMQDQVKRLKSIGLNAAALHSANTREQNESILDGCMRGEIKYLYVSPERLRTSLFTERIKSCHICLLAIDEAHCISQWGHDFRPSYLRIPEIYPLTDNAPIIALTATAQPKVLTEIQELLGIENDRVFKSSFKREDISYLVDNTKDKPGALLNYLRASEGSAIIYSNSRKGTERMASWLRSQEISADSYHAGLNPAERSERQSRWQENEVRVMVCTNAFGMGIDKPDVRLVVHLHAPQNLE